MAGSQTIELTARENFEQTERTAYADIVCGDKTVQLTVIQAGIDYTSLFDPGFAYQLQVHDIISDAGNITREDMDNIAALTMLDISPTSEEDMLTSIRGIEYFRSLTHLDCSSNKLTTIDLSKNTALVELDISTNSLESLDLSQNTALQHLTCYWNDLTSLDLTDNPALKYLRCFGNDLRSLDLSGNPALTDLDCSMNFSLTSLDISKNTALFELYCFSTMLTSLDTSNNTALTLLDCSSCELTALDISQNTALKRLTCEYNPGDMESTFPVTAWFENKVFASGFILSIESWNYEGKTITVKFQKAE